VTRGNTVDSLKSRSIICWAEQVRHLRETSKDRMRNASTTDHFINFSNVYDSFIRIVINCISL
jgi:hypothetical protein